MQRSMLSLGPCPMESFLNNTSSFAQAVVLAGFRAEEPAMVCSTLL